MAAPQALAAVPQVLAVTPHALAEVPSHIARSAYEHPGTTGLIGGTLYGTMTAWEKYRPRLATRLAGYQAAWQLSPTAARVHALKARLMQREAAPRSVSWQEDAWLKRLPSQLGPFIMTAGIVHAMAESWHVAQTDAIENVYHTTAFKLPYGMATMTAGFLAVILGIETYVQRLEKRIEQRRGPSLSENIAELQRQVAYARQIQKLAAYICILDDIFPIMVFMRAVL
jgi:hypothetical protein